MAIDIGKSFRVAGANILNYATQKQLLEKQKRQAARDKAQEDLRRSMEKISGMDTPAGVAATRGLVGDIFDPDQELNFRRLQTVLKPGLQYEQTELVNPALAAAGFTGKAAPSSLSAERVLTEKKRGAAFEQLAKKREDERKQAEAESKLRLSKIQTDIQQNKASLAKTITGLMEGVASGSAKTNDLMKSFKDFDTVEKEYANRLEELQSLPDFSQEDEETGETTFNEKYTKQVKEIEDAQAAARTRKDAILSILLQSTPDAQKLDAATGGGIAGNVAPNTRQRMADELLRREFPDVWKQIQREKQASAAQVVSQGSPRPTPAQVARPTQPAAAQLQRTPTGEVTAESLLQSAGLSGRRYEQTAEPETLRALKGAEGKNILDLIGPRAARAESVTAPGARVKAKDVPVAQQGKNGMITTPDGLKWRYDQKSNRYVQVR